MIVIMLIGGVGSRFKNKYKEQKALIKKYEDITPDEAYINEKDEYYSCLRSGVG